LFKEYIIADLVQNIKPYKPFWLHFNLKGLGTEWIDANLPTPNYFYRFDTLTGKSLDSYCIAYLIHGHFGTQKGFEFLNDVIARFLLTLPVKERLMFPPAEEHLQHDTAYKLKDFQNLKSLTKKYVPKLNATMSGDDNTFWELKLWIEHRIRDNGGEGNYVEYTTLLAHAMHFYEWKDNSTAKAKCRNIWAWYEHRTWTYHILKKSSKTEEEILMTRQERARSNAQAKAEKARKSVINAVTGLYADEYKKVNGKWHIKKIGEAINLDPRVVSKYLKQWEANKDGMFEELK